MKLILNANVEKLGAAGELVNVKNGYGLNFLIPQGLATLATRAAMSSWEGRKKREALKAELDLAGAEQLAAKIAATNVTIAVKTGEDDRIFGSVTTSNIADALAEKSIFVDKRKITLEDVKALGEYTAHVDLHTDVKAGFKVWVVKK